MALRLRRNTSASSRLFLVCFSSYSLEKALDVRDVSPSRPHRATTDQHPLGDEGIRPAQRIAGSSPGTPRGTQTCWTGSCTPSVSASAIGSALNDPF